MPLAFVLFASDEVGLAVSSRLPVVLVQTEAWHPFSPNITQQVSISYVIDPPPSLTIHLQNDPADGNYRVWLIAHATDPLNYVANDSVEIDVEGDHFKVFGSYAADLQMCMSALRQKARQNRAMQWFNVPWVPIDHPAPDTLANLIRTVAAIGGPEATHVLTRLRLAHGVHFDQAIGSVQRGPLFGSQGKGLGPLSPSLKESV